MVLEGRIAGFLTRKPAFLVGNLTRNVGNLTRYVGNKAENEIDISGSRNWYQNPDIDISCW